jgi:pimeloyl-ACP methyl ester carboxylesterase
LSGVATSEVQVGDLRVAYERGGRGGPLLLLHGAVSDGRVWRHTSAALAEDFDVIAWDAPGCGRSSDAPTDFSMADYADCVAGFIDTLALSEPPDVVGHSWGSTLALELCLRHPALVRRLVLVGGYAGWAGSLPREQVATRLAFARAAAAAVESGTWDPRSMPGLFSDVMPVARAEELTTIMSEIRAPATRTMAEALAQSDLSARLDELATPTLVVCGDADERSPVSIGRALHAGIAGSELAILPGVGHECYLEDSDAFAATLRAFLR